MAEEEYNTTSLRFKTAWWFRVRKCALNRKITATELVEQAVDEFLKDDIC